VDRLQQASSARADAMNLPLSQRHPAQQAAGMYPLEAQATKIESLA
jgi:hypothetical protein